MRLKTNKERVLVISDLQIPYHHRDAFKFLKSMRDAYAPTHVVSIGDEVDQYGLSSYNKDPDAVNAGAEYEQSIKYMRELYEIFPEVKACLSNHMDRVFKRALEAGIPRKYLREINDFMGAPDGWIWASHHDIGGIRYEHGDASSGQRAHRILAESNRKSTVIGHHHAYAGVEYLSNGDETIFGLNVGCLIDPQALAFAYSKKAKHKPVLGCGVVENGVPFFLPMVLNKAGRWGT